MSGFHLHSLPRLSAVRWCSDTPWPYTKHLVQTTTPPPVSSPSHSPPSEVDVRLAASHGLACKRQPATPPCCDWRQYIPPAGSIESPSDLPSLETLVRRVRQARPKRKESAWCNPQAFRIAICLGRREQQDPRTCAWTNPGVSVTSTGLVPAVEEWQPITVTRKGGSGRPSSSSNAAGGQGQDVRGSLLPR